MPHSVTADLYIFDLDGTLVDSAADICAAIGQTITEALPNAPAVSAERLRPLIGRPLADMFALLAPGAAAGPLAERYRQIYSGICAETTRPYLGVFETLERLNGARRAIATTKKTWMARLVADKLGLTRYFDLVQGTDEFPSKPDPAILRRILAHFDVAPERALMVGDTPADIACARAASVPCAAALYGMGSPDELRAMRPDYVLERFEDVLLLNALRKSSLNAS